MKTSMDSRCQIDYFEDVYYLLKRQKNDVLHWETENFSESMQVDSILCKISFSNLQSDRKVQA